MVELVGGAAALAAPGKPRAEWAGALRHLRRDPVLKRVIRQIGPCTLEPVPGAWPCGGGDSRPLPRALSGA
jgi:DNA-3-methyladenine glycosylase II